MELVEILRAIFALCAVLGMIGACALVAKKAGLTADKFNIARTKRLSLVETLSIDKRRKAAIIRIDSEEHLVILNQNSVAVVARNLPTPLPSGDLANEKQDTENQDKENQAKESQNGEPVFAEALATLKTFGSKNALFDAESFDVKAAIAK